MNKKIIAYIGLFMALLASCKKDQGSPFQEPPQERMAQTLTALNTSLKSGYGWVFYTFTQLNDQGYSFYTQFNDSNRVGMLSDLDSISGTVLKTSSYRTQWMQQPSLIFDTYNYLHRLADPMGASGGVGGKDGSGLISDFSFGLTQAAIDSLAKNPTQTTTLPMNGRFNNLKVVFYKTSSDEAIFWKSGGIWQMQKSINAYLNKFIVSGVVVSTGKPVQLNFGNKTLALSWIDGDSIHTKSLGFAYGYNKIVLEDSVDILGFKLIGLSWANNILSANFIGKSIPLSDLGSPAIALYRVLGGSVTTITNTTTVQTGTSTDFTARRNAANNAMLTGGYNLTLREMIFKFDNVSKTMLLTTNIYQNATKFTGGFSYDYKMTSDGKYKFTPTGLISNATIIAGNMAPLLDQRINTDNFAIQYVKSSTGAWLGQFVSIEHPDFSFSGALQ